MAFQKAVTKLGADEARADELADDLDAKGQEIVRLVAAHFMQGGYFDGTESRDERDMRYIGFVKAVGDLPIKAVSWALDWYLANPTLSKAGNPQAPKPAVIRKTALDEIERRNMPNRIMQGYQFAADQFAKTGTLPSFVSDNQIFGAIAHGKLTEDQVRQAGRILPSYAQDRIDNIKSTALLLGDKG